ncbi:hypothetical protein AB0H45_17210 [Streptomyces atroolivaceus]|uniref:hypothetical protein n=1 Tax=Streptomyces atroolivaceus TaxID=66869 RepID=UPI0033E90406
MLSLPAQGIFNMHAGALPQHVGRAALMHTLVSGEQQLIRLCTRSTTASIPAR